MLNVEETDSPTTIIMAHCGRYEIHKISITTARSETSSKRQPKLGLELKSSEWMSRDLFISFGDRCGIECVSIKQVAPRSLAEQAGVKVGDSLCYSNDKVAGVVFHALLQLTPSNSVQWHLMTAAHFQDLVTDHRKQKQSPLIFYVARKMATAVPTCNAAETNSVNSNNVSNNASHGGVTLSSKIVARAATFSSLSIEEQTLLLADAQADAKQHFERERDTILEALPDNVKDMFFQVGFVPWGRTKNSYLPVVILSPYSVPPGSNARKTWMQKFHAVRKVGSVLLRGTRDSS